MSLPITEQPRTEVEWLDVADVPLAAIRYDGITQDALVTCFDEGFNALRAAIEAGVVVPAGSPLAVYHGDPSATFDAEIAFPVVTPLTSESEHAGLVVRPSVVAGGRYATVTHVGGYDGLGPAWGGLLGAVAAAGAQPEHRFVEVYVTEPSPEADPATMRTELFAPVR
ncbi:MAG TPA: GyrI-like domain-containing protein [Aldersonia sp.]